MMEVFRNCARCGKAINPSGVGHACAEPNPQVREWGVTFWDSMEGPGNFSETMVTASTVVEAIEAAARKIKFHPDHEPVRVEARLLPPE